MSKPKIIATLAVLVCVLILGWLYYGIIMPDFYEAHTGIAQNVSSMPPNMPLLILGMLVTAYMMVVLYEKWASGTHTALNGFVFGAYLGILLGIGLGLVWYATSNIWDSTAAIVEGIWTIIYFGIAGMLIGLVYKSTAPDVA
jgi:hypothetical protein